MKDEIVEEMSNLDAKTVGYGHFEEADVIASIRSCEQGREFWGDADARRSGHSAGMNRNRLGYNRDNGNS